MSYHVSAPHEYLVITGAGIKDVVIKKKAFVLPMQKYARISISPFDFSLDLQAMTTEKLQFALPAVFTIGPDMKMDSLRKYAMLLSAGADMSAATINRVSGSSHVQDIVKGIIEGETRVIVSCMTMEEIFKEREVFKKKVVENVQKELDQFGLRIYNANVKELQDTKGNEYFTFLSRKAHQGAQNQSKIEVAEANMKGEIGEAEKKGKTKQEISRIDAETAVLETKRRSEKAQADAQLSNRETELNMGIQLKQIETKREAEMRDTELQKAIEVQRGETELERLRAVEVSRSTASKESAQQDAEATLYSQQKNADAVLYKQKIDSEAHYYHQGKVADATLLAKQKEAEGMIEMANAEFVKKQKESEGLMEMSKAYGALGSVLGGPQALMQYLMIQNNTYQSLARFNAQAIQGLEPKITVWNTGNGDGSQDNTAPIRNIMQSLPPLFSTIHDQTGISPPSWMAQLPQNQQSQAPSDPSEVELMKQKGFTANTAANRAPNGTNGAPA